MRVTVHAAVNQKNARVLAFTPISMLSRQFILLASFCNDWHYSKAREKCVSCSCSAVTCMELSIIYNIMLAQCSKALRMVLSSSAGGLPCCQSMLPKLGCRQQLLALREMWALSRISA